MQPEPRGVEDRPSIVQSLSRFFGVSRKTIVLSPKKIRTQPNVDREIDRKIHGEEAEIKIFKNQGKLFCFIFFQADFENSNQRRHVRCIHPIPTQPQVYFKLKKAQIFPNFKPFPFNEKIFFFKNDCRNGTVRVSSASLAKGFQIKLFFRILRGEIPGGCEKRVPKMANSSGNGNPSVETGGATIHAQEFREDNQRKVR